jgi:hypothetical protein
MEKTCSKCGEKKSINLFYKNRNVCKACNYAIDRIRAHKNKLQNLNFVPSGTKMKKCSGCEVERPQTHFRPRVHFKNGLHSRCLWCEFLETTHYRNRDRTNQLDITLTEDKYFEIIFKPCVYCKGKNWSYVQKANGIDRVLNEHGYHVWNSVSSCYTCNMIKGDAPVDDLFTFSLNYPQVYNELISAIPEEYSPDQASASQHSLEQSFDMKIEDQVPCIDPPEDYMI